jgi:enoyl-CoA hydratase/carnithine racemase
VDGAAADPIEDRMRGFHNLLVAMDRYPAPVIAAVNGDCVGGGVEYALFADAVLAAPHARFGFPEIRHGLLPADKGIQRLIRLIGTRPTASSNILSFPNTDTPTNRGAGITFHLGSLSRRPRMVTSTAPSF